MLMLAFPIYSDSHWWKGLNAAGKTGYFPATYVTYNLAAPVPVSAPAAAQPEQPAPQVPHFSILS
jgi:hypothetical protein